MCVRMYRVEKVQKEMNFCAAHFIPAKESLRQLNMVAKFIFYQGISPMSLMKTAWSIYYTMACKPGHVSSCFSIRPGSTILASLYCSALLGSSIKY